MVTALEAGRGPWRLTDAEYGGARPAVHREDPEEAAVRIVPVEVGVRMTCHRLFEWCKGTTRKGSCWLGSMMCGRRGRA